MIHRYIEETLDLLRVQIHRKHAICPSRHQKVSHKLGTDGNTRLIFTILTGVPIVWQHSGYPVGTSAAESIEHDKQLHQILVRWWASALNHEYIFSTNVFFDFHKGLTVRKITDDCLS